MATDDISAGMGVVIMGNNAGGYVAVAGAEHLVELAADAAFDAAIAAELNTLIALADAVSAADEASAGCGHRSRFGSNIVTRRRQHRYRWWCGHSRERRIPLQ